MVIAGWSTPTACDLRSRPRSKPASQHYLADPDVATAQHASLEPDRRPSGRLATSRQWNFKQNECNEPTKSAIDPQRLSASIRVSFPGNGASSVRRRAASEGTDSLNVGRRTAAAVREPGRGSMPLHQLAPYVISMRDAGSIGADKRPIDNLNGKGERLVDILGFTLKAAGKALYQFPKQEDTSFTVSRVLKGKNVLWVETVMAIKGIESEFTDGKGETAFKRMHTHNEHITFRSLFLFPSGGHHAFLLTERIGNSGVVTFLRNLLIRSTHANYHGTHIDIDALTTVRDLADADVRLKSINFIFPGGKDPSGRFADPNDPDGHFTMKYNFGHKRKISKFLDGDKVDPSKIFGVLTPAIGALAGTATPDSLKQMGVRASLNVMLPSGHERTFTLGSQDGPSLMYPIGDLDQGGQESARRAATTPRRPGDDRFIIACKDAIADVEGTYGVTSAHQDECQKPARSLPIAPPKGWEVTWYANKA